MKFCSLASEERGGILVAMLLLIFPWKMGFKFVTGDFATFFTAREEICHLEPTLGASSPKVNVPQKGVGKGGRPLTFFFGHVLVTIFCFWSRFGNLFLVFGYVSACPLLPTPFGSTIIKFACIACISSPPLCPTHQLMVATGKRLDSPEKGMSTNVRIMSKKLSKKLTEGLKTISDIFCLFGRCVC